MKIFSLQSNYGTNSQLKKSIAFNAGWKLNAEKVFYANSAEIKNYAEAFHKKPTNSILEICKSKSAEMSMLAFNRFQTAIDNVNALKEKALSQINTIEKHQFKNNSQMMRLDELKSYVSSLDKKAEECDNLYKEYEPSYTYDDPDRGNIFESPVDLANRVC